ncbi:glycoside hydrolase family 3 C-terminal domain-containing protein [Micromonospora sp. NBC_01699]|uniref:glycoside hydrolase family 3 C-terminal domain-containing protein n=1 Tax=Micromonospora sp. NBC_01699 TaxID=2975984 RepID=UPI002E2C5660|nr:glycoside hydrolase family 3 C-terminal domain-containing protein [Micromonospora sp. NBC_01699]
MRQPTMREALPVCAPSAGGEPTVPARPATRTEPGRGFRDPDRPLADRVADLLGQLTLDEKIGLLHQYQAAIPRLGVDTFRTGTEALHGLAWLGPATVFPQAVGLASSWHPDLLRAVGDAVGDEVRARHRQDPTRIGLNVWAPVVNPLRDPRWGRNEEGYAEDPWLTGVLGTAYATGLRGDHPDYLKTAPTLKHFLGYNNETDRCLSSSNLPPRVLHEYELPAFRAPLAAGAAVAVMASYNLVNGRPAHLSPLLRRELRDSAPGEIMVVGDAGAVTNLAGAQGYLPDHPNGYAAALRAGVDNVTEDDTDGAPSRWRFTEALRRGLLVESDLDDAVRRQLTIRFRLGEFDPPARNPYARIGAEVVDCATHRRLARQAAEQSFVLLRNDGLLPLHPDRIGRVAVLGPLAGTLHVDWYSGTLPYAVTALDGLTERLGAGVTAYHPGVDRIALRVAGPDAGWVHATADPAGAPLTVQPEPGRGPIGEDGPIGEGGAVGGGGPASWFEVYDWGRGLVALRAVGNGRHVGGDPAGVLVNDRPGPGGWLVRETFRLVERGDGTTLLRHEAGECFVTVGPDRVLRADASDAASATPFTVERIEDGAAEAALIAADADVAVVVLGNHPMVNGRETEDRLDLALPAAQEALLRAVRAANPRTVLVLTSGYPYAVNWADEHLPALLWSAHGGQEYGHALAAVLCGDADPGGRLTQTWYRAATELPDLFDYDVIASDATYLYYRGSPLYPFGHGLSYTSFAYTELRCDRETVDPDGTVEVSVEVTNTGDRPGVEVVQLYTRQRRSRVKQPLRQLRGFARVTLDPGERATVRLPLRAADLAHWDVTTDRYVVERARHTVSVGRSSQDLLASATLTVRGERIGPRDPRRGPLRAATHDEYAAIVAVPDGGLGDAVEATEAGAWLRFAAVDFGTGVSGLTARIASPQPPVPGPPVPVPGAPPRGPGPAGRPGPTGLTLRLDDPVDGPVVGTVPVPAMGLRDLDPAQPRDWAEVTGRWRPAQATGVRDLYLVFDAPGVTVSWLSFVSATIGQRPVADAGGV